MIPILITLVLVFFALVVGVIIGLTASNRGLFQKNVGEASVAHTITHNFQRPHTLLNNVTLLTGGETTQIDHILVTDTGIFVIETKHYSGWIFGNPGDAEWTQVIFRHKSRFQNPLRQNYRHIKALQCLFSLPAEAFHSIVVFTGDAELKTNLGPEVVRLQNLIALLEAERLLQFDERKMTYVVGRIEMKRMRRSLETDEYHLNSVQRRLTGL
jgi:restriction system protein